jgi:hypothetical protein
LLKKAQPGVQEAGFKLLQKWLVFCHVEASLPVSERVLKVHLFFKMHLLFLKNIYDDDFI